MTMASFFSMLGSAVQSLGAFDTGKPKPPSFASLAQELIDLHEEAVDEGSQRAFPPPGEADPGSGCTRPARSSPSPPDGSHQAQQRRAATRLRLPPFPLPAVAARPTRRPP